MIMVIAERNMMMTYAECVDRFGTRYQTKKKINTDSLFLIERGIYAEQPDVPEIAVLAHKYPRAVFTMQTAFYFHDMTDVIPEKYDLATGRNAAKITDNRVKQHFYPDNILQEGADTFPYMGYDLIMYNRERMLIELIRYKSKLPYDYYKEILLNYRRILPSLNIQKIQDYAILVPKSDTVLSVLQTEVF